MKSIKLFLLLLLVGIRLCYAQDTTLLLKPNLLDKDSSQIFISEMQGWLFKQGNDTSYAKKDIDLTGWERLMPSELSEKLVDKKGRLEGWFRIKIKVDSSFGETIFGVKVSTWAASDFYINGNWVASKGNTGINGSPYKEHRITSNLLPVPVNLKPGNEYTLVIHVVDYLSQLPPYELKAKEVGLRKLIRITVPKYYHTVVSEANSDVTFRFTVFSIISAVLSFFFWVLFFQNRSEKNLLLFAVASSFLTINLVASVCSINWGFVLGGLSYNWFWFCKIIPAIFLQLYFSLIPFILASIFKRKVPVIFSTFLLFYLVYIIIDETRIIEIDTKIDGVLTGVFIVLIIVSCIYYLVSSWKKLIGAQWAIVVGLIFAIFMLVLTVTLTFILNISISLILTMATLLFLSFPMSMMVYVAMRFKEIIKEVRVNAMQVVQMSEEKKEQALHQQEILQEEVIKQTAEIRTALDNLKSTQHQLIQSEKMASLGELTAGIAHEIQNPLNFVNNFSEVSTELVDEMNEELLNGNTEDAKQIGADLKENLVKINFHGKRAGDIVKGMLQHSRSSSGVKEPTDINALADEYLRLAYHGLRAKDKSFNATLITDFDESIGKIDLIPQDMGRVILNLITNAFYAVSEKKKIVGDGFEPTVTVSTKKLAGKILISVADNGNGIPQKVLDKIFQPFFTTKPTGQGTGLGLSLSYDIVKAHTGELKVETKEGGGSTFTIILPIQ